MLDDLGGARMSEVFLCQGPLLTGGTTAGTSGSSGGTSDGGGWVLVVEGW